MLRSFCLQPHPFSPSNSDSLGIHPLMKNSQGKSQEDKSVGFYVPFVLLPGCDVELGIACTLWYSAVGAGTAAKLLSNKLLLIFFFLVCFLKKESIVLWTVWNLSTGRKKNNITTKGNRQTKDFIIFVLTLLPNSSDS